jgi:hypothetical protein
MAEWNITIDIDTGDDDETTDIIDDLVWEGIKTIREGMSALNISDVDNVVRATDPNGNRMG